MGFAVHTRKQPGVKDLDATLYVLQDEAGNRATIWPALGFNCFQWQTVVDGQTLDLLYEDPALFSNGRPTRSGIPVLFPFPNRIRGGQFTWDGKKYQLPLNDSTQQNAIHGYACRHPRAWSIRVPRPTRPGSPANFRAAWMTTKRLCPAAGLPITASASPAPWSRAS